MPSPKSGSPGSAVAPAEPKAAAEADNANPGEVEQVKAEQRQSETGKYGSAKTTPHKPASDAPPTESSNEGQEKKKSWIEIKLVDVEGQPVPGEKYLVTLPDNSVAEGTLDEKGFARIEGFDPGSCRITFPNRDKRSWNAKG